MMGYKVTIQFTDLQDGGHLYNVGDAFPRQGHKVSEARIAELSGENNLRHLPLIKKVEDKEDKKDDKPKSLDDAKSKPRKKK